MMPRPGLAAVAACLALASPAAAQGTPRAAELDRRIAAVSPKVIAWRRDIHQHPELGNRETRTAELVATHLRALGMSVRTGIAHTGVLGVLRGARPGPVIALRADMDALPVTEQVDVPFRSTVRTVYNGLETGVMHACGHDTHVAILMGVAELLAGMRSELPGTVLFVFQPAEEGAPPGEEGGAELMLREGAFADPAPEVAFGLHVGPDSLGRITYRSGPMMAAADFFSIVVKGRQTHGARPWAGVDPIVVAGQIAQAVQLIPARQLDQVSGLALLSIGMIQGGIRNNIIPDSVVMLGTMRNLHEPNRGEMHRRLVQTAQSIATASGATARVVIDTMYPVTANDPRLTARMLPTLRRAAGEGRVVEVPPIMGSEDFSFFANAVPGLFFFLGVTPRDRDPATAAPNHSPLFYADEAALPVGVKALASLALDYAAQWKPGMPRPAVGASH